MQNPLRFVLRSICLFVLMTASMLMLAQQADKDKSREILPQEAEDRQIDGKISRSLATNFPINIRGISYKVSSQDPESAAREYLKGNQELFGLTDDQLNNDFTLIAIRNGLSGKVVRLQQNYRGVPVYNAQITVHINESNRVTYVANAFRYGISNLKIEPTITKHVAFDGAILQTKITLPTTYLKEELVVYKSSEGQHLAYRHVLTGQEYNGEWEVITDALTGTILKTQNVTSNCKMHDHSTNVVGDLKVDTPKKNQSSEMPLAFMANGTGNVFNPDPLTSARATYGDAGFVDGNDANTPEMTATLESVQLLEITQNGLNFELKGPWAEVIDHESPFRGLFSQPSSAFNYDRSDNNFEAVNAYYHIDASMRYINLTLGLNITPYQYSTGVKVDPSGLGGLDHSHYTAGNGSLAFGEGGVDDAEDSDMIHHQLGHGLHDWVTSGGMSQSEGLSEGTGDYWAATYNRSIDQWTPADPEYYYLFRWDGHNEFWGGRTVNYRPNAPAPPYPGGLTGNRFEDGQIWATCMMDVYDQIGKDKTDVIFWTGLSMTNGSSNQDDAANAVFQAAIDMDFKTFELKIIEEQLEACGYDLPPVPLSDCNLSGNVKLTGTIATDQSTITQGSIDSEHIISGGADIFYQAGTEVNLNNPIEVEHLSKLTVAIEDCNDLSKKQ